MRQGAWWGRLWPRGAQARAWEYGKQQLMSSCSGLFVPNQSRTDLFFSCFQNNKHLSSTPPGVHTACKGGTSHRGTGGIHTCNFCKYTCKIWDVWTRMLDPRQGHSQVVEGELWGSWGSGAALDGSGAVQDIFGKVSWWFLPAFFYNLNWCTALPSPIKAQYGYRLLLSSGAHHVGAYWYFTANFEVSGRGVRLFLTNLLGFGEEILRVTRFFPCI